MFYPTCNLGLTSLTKPLSYSSKDNHLVIQTGRRADEEFLSQFSRRKSEFTVLPIYMRFRAKYAGEYAAELMEYFAEYERKSNTFVFQRGDYTPTIPSLHSFRVVKHSCAIDDTSYVIPYNVSETAIHETKPIEDAQYDLSFVGADTSHPIRKDIPAILEPLGSKAYYKKTPFFHTLNEQTQTALKKEYNDHLNDTQFVLCPPGLALNTIRFFEAIKIGRIPILMEPCKLPFDWLVDYNFVLWHKPLSNIAEEMEEYRHRFDIHDISQHIKSIYKMLDWNPCEYLNKIVDHIKRGDGLD